MKKFCICLCLVVLVLITCAPLAGFAQDQKKDSPISSQKFSISFGSFFPNNDNMQDWDSGPAVDFSSVTSFNDYFAIMCNLVFTDTEIDKGPQTGELTTSGAEFLGLLQYNKSKIQPYIGAGFGVYHNNLEGKGTFAYSPTSTYKWEDTGAGLGWNGVAGVRINLNEDLFLKAQGKIFTNNQEIEYNWKGSETNNFGGTTLQGGIGYNF